MPPHTSRGPLRSQTIMSMTCHNRGGGHHGPGESECPGSNCAAEYGEAKTPALLELFRQLSDHEQIGLARSFDTHDETSSRERKNIGKDQKLHQQLSADDEVGREQNNVGRDGQFDVVKLHEQLSVDEQIGQARSFHCPRRSVIRRAKGCRKRITRTALH